MTGSHDCEPLLGAMTGSHWPFGDGLFSPLCWTLLPPRGHPPEPHPLFDNDRLISSCIPPLTRTHTHTYTHTPPYTLTRTTTTTNSTSNSPLHPSSTAHLPLSQGWINIARRYITCCYGDQLVVFFLPHGICGIQGHAGEQGALKVWFVSVCGGWGGGDSF